nr:unnamed protein product [Digitaria exilis]
MLAIAMAILQVASAKSWLNQFTTDGRVSSGNDASGQKVVMLNLDPSSGAAGLNSKQQSAFASLVVAANPPSTTAPCQEPLAITQIRKGAPESGPMQAHTSSRCRCARHTGAEPSLGRQAPEPAWKPAPPP